MSPYVILSKTGNFKFHPLINEKAAAHANAPFFRFIPSICFAFYRQLGIRERFGLEGPFKDHLVPTPGIGRDTLH